MRGDDEVIALLNEQLTSELTAINQYFLHSKMQDNWGFTKLAANTRAESFEEMRHAEALTDRILLLDGLPNYQRLFSVRIGQTIREQFEADLAIELEVAERLRPGHRAVPGNAGTPPAPILLETIMADEEDHVDYLETQLELMDSLGEQLYLAQWSTSRPAWADAPPVGGHRPSAPTRPARISSASRPRRRRCVRRGRERAAEPRRARRRRGRACRCR